MKNKSLKFASIILTLLFLALSAIPFIFTYYGEMVYYERYISQSSSATEAEYGSVYTVFSTMKKGNSSELNVVYYKTDIVNGIALLVPLFAAIGLIASIASYKGKNTGLINLLLFSPVMSAAALIAMAIFMDMGNKAQPGAYNGYSLLLVYEPTIGFYIEIVIVIALAIISYLIVSQKQINIDLLKSNPSHDVNAADELIKYKDLLDSGAITQEEFDMKKKQLLNL